jgi:hypothetical protein
MAGTGGASEAIGTPRTGERAGEGSRNVLSVIDPELPLRSSGGAPPLCDPLTELPIEDVDPVLRIVRLVCTSATFVGVVGLDRSAAAAAAEERDAFEAWFRRKTEVAAVMAAALAVDPLRGGFDAALLRLFPNMSSQ